MVVLRRIRGVVVAAGLWFVAWVPLGLGIGVWMHALVPGVQVNVGDTLMPQSMLLFVAVVAAVCSLWGALSGALFALLFMGAERARPIQDLSRARVALWGGVAGACLPVVLNLFNLGQWGWGWATWLTLSLGAGMGAGCAITMVTLAQRSRADVAA